MSRVTGFHRFEVVLIRFRKTLYGALGGSIVPVVSSVAGIDPPWPSKVALVTALGVLLAVVFSFQMLDGAPRNQVNKTMWIALVVLIVASVLYFALMDTFVYQVQTTGDRMIAGCGWTTNAKAQAALYGADAFDGCPGQFKAMLATAQWEGSVIWTSRSITAVKMTILVTWILAFVALSVMLGAFVVFQSSMFRRGEPNRKPSTLRRLRDKPEKPTATLD